jgi:hypothetical protein
MSSQPECQGCGVYVHSGPCLCEGCAGLRDKRIVELVAMVRRLAHRLEWAHNSVARDPNQGVLDGARVLIGDKAP